MLTKYVELYYNEFNAFTTISQTIATPATTGVTNSITNSYINAVSNHTISFTAPQNFFAIIYEFDQISTPSFNNEFIECTRLTSIHLNWCTMLGYPVNYIVEYSYLGTFGTSVSSILNFTNGVYSGTFPATVRIFSSGSVTLMKNSFNIVYTPYSIVSGNASFSMVNTITSTLYKGS